MDRKPKGFSLIELLVALLVSLCLSTMMFHLFHQNERVIRDQTLIMEMQQTARVVASQIADEIRMAGQGVPVYAANFDTSPSEAVAVFLSSSGENRIDFRAGLSNTETAPSASGPSDFSLGISRGLSVGSATGMSVGKFVYVSGPGSNGRWNWLRAELDAVSSTSLTLTPRNTGTTDTAIHFTATPTVALEEAISIYFSSGTVRHATASNLTNPASPAWGAANEIGKNLTALTFTYYDLQGNIMQPSSLANRMAIARVDIQLTAEVAGPLSNGTHPSYSLVMRTIPRNARIKF
jgi:prepilin-type N-terminal cleavage/methylation domain-containing protein